MESMVNSVGSDFGCCPEAATDQQQSRIRAAGAESRASRGILERVIHATFEDIFEWFVGVSWTCFVVEFRENQRVAVRAVQVVRSGAVRALFKREMIVFNL
jgi:hypothetical protein